MSKLGKVYVICIDKKQKNMYPVVYMNKDFIYCKQYGESMLAQYYHPDHRAGSTYHYEDFKKEYEDGGIDNDRTYSVYVPAHVKTFFEWIREKSPLEMEIEKVKYQISKLRYRSEAIKRNMRIEEGSLLTIRTLIDDNEAKLVELQKQLSAMEKEDN